ncbi:polysaccharide lyase family protein, partial [Sphingobacterium athyrii]|uniref:polysaccharide lyase family protein n=1 Tax=Sphingobacterium athyrii TaxID=2152717 RepID=UPI0028A758E6
MKKHFPTTILTGLLLISGRFVSGQENTVWQLGNPDGSSKEFALAPHDYKGFLEHDFGYEDKYFIVGESSLSRDLPYVLPGPANEWGGTGGTSGLRTHFLNLYSVLGGHIENGKWVLEVKLANNDPKNKPTLQIAINGKPYNYELKNGDGPADPAGTGSKPGASTIR